MVRVDVLYVEDDVGLVRDLLAELEDNGLEIHPSSASPVQKCPLIVLITPAMLRSDREEHAKSLAEHYEEILPISFLPGAAKLFGTLSQSRVAQLGVEETGKRIAKIALYGGRWSSMGGDGGIAKDFSPGAHAPACSSSRIRGSSSSTIEPLGCR